MTADSAPTCLVHPRYRAVRAPRSTKPGCTCAAVYAAAHPEPTRVLAIDPGASPGFAYVVPDRLGVGTAMPLDLAAAAWDAVVIEDQFLATHVYRNGRRVRVSPRSQITLIRTAERMLLAYDATTKYRMSPSAWRAVLWPGSGRLPKATVVARLRKEEPALLAMMSDDAAEARGILRAFLKLTPAQRKKFLVK